MARSEHRSSLHEPRRQIPLDDESDVVVCGGGPAGVAAALGAARLGARTTLVESQGTLGGVWTSGALSWIIDAALKPGVMAEIVEALEAAGADTPVGFPDFSYDVERMKLVLESLCTDAGIRMLFNTDVVGARVHEGQLQAIITESKSGRIAFSASTFVDCTGDGDVAALAGCQFEIGHPQTGQLQPMSLMALVSGISVDEMHDVIIANDVVRADEENFSLARRRKISKHNLLRELGKAGFDPSYTGISLFKVHDDVFALMANHQYGVRPDDVGAITSATIEARREINQVVEALRLLGGRWSGLRLINTAAQIGVREGRRIAGRYHITRDDVMRGAQHEDAVARVAFGFDVHALTRAEGGYRSPTMSDVETRARPYEIPLRALIARDVDGLLMAGRCISGDFWAHSSYRVTGNAVATGEAAGVAAAVASSLGCTVAQTPWAEISKALPYQAVRTLERV
ncbi:FAD-dependent oxidoreductase [Occultella aeris]|uniref:FAD-dependent oxidoreductase n=1 Tax=Occultella aeris TaxID=2761496 RepID=A0A7M4DRJ9_9MICO|nr:FAD-dependent oxidoreductase [Occultella aeris]VZO40093.1 hypothetical protein HALOF300_04794 [Occultella aeris]